MQQQDTNPRGEFDHAVAIGLAALGWIVADPDRAERLLALTGISPVELRVRADEPPVLVAVLSFLEAHEPDLFACSSSLGRAPIELVNARRMLEG